MPEKDGARLVPVAWSDVKDGDTVWTDSYQDGKFPNANPRICGPFVVKRARDRVLLNTRFRYGRTFTHYPETLLRETE
jgi:hypothetical protein